jgi:hypothetical protein
MQRKILRAVALRSCALVVVFGATWQAQAQDPKTPYPSMAPFDQYLMERTAEIALRGAPPRNPSHRMPRSWSSDNMVTKPWSKESGLVCVVERSWTAGTDDPDFWNPKVRDPICFNSRPHDPTFHLLSRKPR